MNQSRTCPSSNRSSLVQKSHLTTPATELVLGEWKLPSVHETFKSKTTLFLKKWIESVKKIARTRK